jgi:hypothetical protein
MRLLSIAGLCLTLPVGAEPQVATVDTRCQSSAQLATQDACQKVLDLFGFMTPQLAASVAGGSAALGESGSLGGLGHVSVGLRANVVAARIPLVRSVLVSPGGAVSGNYQLAGALITLPTLDAAIGLFRGIALPGTQGLAFDALVNVAWIPGTGNDQFDISVPEAGFRLGYGGRLTLLDESIITPGITATYLRRGVPALDLVARPATDELSMRDLSIESSQWRVSLLKHVGLFAVSLGVGQDRSSATASLTAQVRRDGNSQSLVPFTARQRLTRDNAFFGVAVDVPLVRVGGELGRINGGRIETFNAFGDSRAADALLYATIGVRLHF